MPGNVADTEVRLVSGVLPMPHSHRRTPKAHQALAGWAFQVAQALLPALVTFPCVALRGVVGVAFGLGRVVVERRGLLPPKPPGAGAAGGGRGHSSSESSGRGPV
jgi:hypothetical protein